MKGAIFLSASVPDPLRSERYASTASSVAIASAVSALVYVTMGRRSLVWGGHPAITPMVRVVAEDLGVLYGDWVTLYQTEFFRDEFPEDNETFRNVTYTPVVDGDREKSLRLMRERMFKEHEFGAAVFVGGMGGILDEFDLFRQHQPNASALPILSTGGAALDLADKVDRLDGDLADELDYVALFHRRLGISARERRYRRPLDQPATVEERYRR